MVKRGLLVLVILLFLLVLVPLSYPGTVSLSSCGPINTSGDVYQLGNNVVLSSGLTCFTFVSGLGSPANHTIFDCLGNRIDDGMNGTGTAILATSLTNITIRNCDIRRFVRGISFSNINASEVSNNTFHDGNYSIVLTATVFNNVSFNRIYNGTKNGVWLVGPSSSHNIIRNNTVSNLSELAGFDIEAAINTTLLNNTAYDSSTGFRLSVSNNSNLTFNIAYNITGTGFLITNLSNNNTLFGNIAYNNTRYGVHINTTSSNNISFSNISNNSLGGIYIERGSSDNRIFSNTIYNHTAPAILVELVNAVNRIYSNLFIENNTIGIYLNSSNLTNITDNILRFNTNTGIFLNLSYNNNATNNTANNNSLFNFVVFLGADNNLSYNTANNSNIGFNFTLTSNNSINFNNATENRNYGLYFVNSTGNNLSLNNATNPSAFAQFFFTNANATLTGTNYALNTLRTSVDLNMTSDSNVTTRNSDGTFNNFTTDYGTIFFHAATNVSVKLMNRTDSGAATTGCSGFSGTCTLVTVGNNVVNITNTSTSGTIDLGLYHDSTAASSSIYVARYTSSGWSQVGQTAVDTTTVRYNGITSFSTFAAVSFLAASQTNNVVQEKAKDTGGGTGTETPSTPPAETPREETPPAEETPEEEPKTEEEAKEEVYVPVLETLGDFPIDLGPLPNTIDIQVAPDIPQDKMGEARDEFKDAQKDEERIVLRTTLIKEEDERGSGGRADVEFKVVKREVSEGVIVNVPKLDVKLKHIKKVDRKTLKKLSPKDIYLWSLPSYAILVLPLAMLFLVLAAGKDINVIGRRRISRSKKGQIFLIASIIFVLALYSVVIPYNTIKTYPALENFKDLSSNYQTEFPKVYNWALYQGLNVDTSLNNFNKAFLDQAKKTDPKFGAFYAFKDSDGNLKIVNTLNNKVMKITYTSDVNAEDVTLTLLSSDAGADGNICVTGQGCGNANADVGDYDKTFYTTKTPQKIDKLGIEIGDQPMLVDVTKFTGMTFLTSSEQGELPDSPNEVKVSVVQY